MVKHVYFDESARRGAAAEIETKIKAISAKVGIHIRRCVWNLDMGMNHDGPHRLDVHVEGHVLRIYFSDHELARYWGMEETEVTDNRLQELLVRLPDLLVAVRRAKLREDYESRVPATACPPYNKRGSRRSFS